MGQLVDMQSALDELGLDQEDFVEFIGDLKEFFSESVPELIASVSARDFQAIKEKAHAIKGAAANLRFVAVAEIALFLESAGRNENPEGIDSKIEELQDCIQASFLEVSNL